MNISGLIRGLIGETQAAEPKKLELKAGEVVKGAVTQLLSNDEAMLNIGGVQVRAKLETPLKQGEVTMLQVQPETSGGQVVLKPLHASGVQIADNSLPELLKNVGLPDTGANRQILQALHQAGIPLTKETVQAFVQLQAQMPSSLKLEDWLPSAIVAQQKGIPLTPDSVSAVKQVLTGPAFHETLQQLNAQVASLLNGNQLLSASTKQALEVLRNVFATLKETAGQVLSSPQGASMTQEGTGAAQIKAQELAAQEGPSRAPGASPLTGAGTLNPNADPSSGGIPVPGGSMTEEAAAAKASGGEKLAQAPNSIPADRTQTFISDGDPHTAGTGMPAGPVSKGQAVTSGAFPQSGSQGTEGSTALQGDDSLLAANGGSSGTSSSQVDASGKTVTTQRAPLGANEGAALTSTAEQLPKAAAGGEPETHWISRLVKALGVEHESQLFKLPELAASQRAEAGAAGDPVHAQAHGGHGAQEQVKMGDTLKGALLQLLQSDDLPASLKDTAQQAVQQITGQQLMLNSDKASPFTHVTLFVPLMNANGEQTAAIHIQSRKGKRGEIDAQNCRLVFDLTMKTLGDTMVDVQVVDRIVSLHVHNDQPYIQQLLEAHRDDIAASLAGVGYQFISLKCSPYPEKGQENPRTGPSDKRDLNGMPVSMQSVYANKPYKRMDVRV